MSVTFSIRTEILPFFHHTFKNVKLHNLVITRKLISNHNRPFTCSPSIPHQSQEKETNRLERSFPQFQNFVYSPNRFLFWSTVPLGSPLNGSDNQASSLPSPHPSGYAEGKRRTSGSIRAEIVSRTVRRFGRRVDILGSGVQFGNLFLAGSPDHRMPDEGGGAMLRFIPELNSVRPALPTISELIKLSRRPSVYD